MIVSSIKRSLSFLSLPLIILIIFVHILTSGTVENLAPPSSKPSFTNVIKGSGISFLATFGGASWIDYDNDGKQDLFVLTDYGVRLYQNVGQGKFQDVTTDSGLGLDELRRNQFSTGLFFDFDNDGCSDLYLSSYGDWESNGESDLLFRNNCHGGFVNVTASSGIKDTLHGTGVAVADFDRDGFLDVYISNYSHKSSAGKAFAEPNILYRNNHDGTFSNVTLKADVAGLAKCQKIDGLPATPRSLVDKQSLQPIWFDYNNDGWPDLFVTNDGQPGPLYRNNADGTFTDVTEEVNLCKQGSWMGVTVGDYDNDGFMDLYVTDTGNNTLWKNIDGKSFASRENEVDVRNTASLGWGTQFFDYDNDGYLDLYAVNGLVRFGRKLFKISNHSDKLYQATKAGIFREVSKKEGIVGDEPKLAGALADFNNDGFVDIFVVGDYARTGRTSTQSKLYRNQPNGNHWLEIKLEGRRSNRDAIGARIVLTVAGSSQIREVVSGSSFFSQNSLWQAFGLGSHKSVDSLEILWPSGQKQKIVNIKSDQMLQIKEELKGS
jgi:hypothetical protein